jgi:hypothetical protein
VNQEPTKNIRLLRQAQNGRNAWSWVRRNGGIVAGELLVNFGLPFLIFVYSKGSLGEACALAVSSGPPIAWTIIEFARRRRIDALSLLVLAGIGFSLLALIGGGGARFLQLRERLVTGAIGLVFLGSAALGRPLIYQLARARLKRKSASALRSLEALQDNPVFRRAMMVMTVVWGAGLIIESAICGALVFALTIPQYLLANPIIGYSSAGILTAWTFWYARRQVKAARKAATTGV